MGSFHKALFRDEISLLADYLRHFSSVHGLMAPDPFETARMFAGGLVQIRRDHFADLSAFPVRADVDLAVRCYIDNFLHIVLPGAT